MNVPDIGFRLVYELPYLGDKNFSLFFHHKGPLPKKYSKIFQKLGMTIYDGESEYFQTFSTR